MPQLDVGTFPTQLFWLAVTFAILFVLMAKVALPQVGAVIEARAARIDGDLARAREAKAQSDAALAAYEQAIAAARAEAQATIKAAVDVVNAKTAEREREVSAKLAAEAAQAETRIIAAKQAALANVRTIAAEAVGAAVEKLIGQSLSQADAQTAVEQVLGGRA